MKITKYEHACFSVELDGKLLIVDPGNFTHDLGTPEHVAAIVVTHEHADHFDQAAINELVAHNPGVVVIGHESVVRQLGGSVPTRSARAGDQLDFGPFKLEFFGGNHATIHPGLPAIANLGVMINDTVYYPGDSFTKPDKPVDVLALPAGAPWMKISEAMDFLTDVHPRFAFPTHDAIYSDDGKAIADMLLSGAAKNAGIEYRRLHDPIEQ